MRVPHLQWSLFSDAPAAAETTSTSPSDNLRWGAAPADTALSWILSLLLPSPLALAWLMTGFAVGVTAGCLGASALRPCAFLHAAPVIVAVAALYALAYLS